MTDITQFLIAYGGPVLFAIVFAEQAGLPLPSAPWLLAAGALSATGRLSPTLSIGVTASAAVLADSIWFYVGRRGGQRVLRLFCRLSLSRNTCVGRTKGLFARHGLQALVAAKFLPGLGAVMPPLAGALGMSTRRFLLFDGLGASFYASFYIGAGFLFHHQLGNALGWSNRLGLGAVLLGLILIMGYIAFKYFRRRKLVRRGHTVLNPAGAPVQAGSVTSGTAERTATLSPEPLSALEFHSAALTVATSSSQAGVTPTSLPLV